MTFGIRSRAKAALSRRQQVRAVTGKPGSLTQDQERRLPAGAEVYQGLVPQSLSLAGLRQGTAPPQVSIVLPPITPGKIFAGVGTALEFGRQLANALGRPLRVVPLGDGPARPLEREITEFLARTGIAVPKVTVAPESLLPHTTVNSEDVWIVTYWTTAHAADVAARLGVLDPAKVVYLIQDYEPGFHPWSVPFALTRATYHAGFHHAINSKSLAQFLVDREGTELDHELVFAPNLELELLERVAAERRMDDAVRIFFYGRPNKPRNLFGLGVATLRAASVRLDQRAIPWTAVSAGEPHPEIRLKDVRSIPSLGTLSWNDYFALLSRIDVGLCLMLSPHPSHPPLEVAVSGGLTVTNDLDGARADFHPRVSAVAADVDALADAVVAAAIKVRSDGPQPFAPPEPGRLGQPLDSVIEALAKRLG
jgi:hypothetical protein